MRIEPSDLVVERTCVNASYFVTIYAERPSRNKPNIAVPLEIEYDVHKTGRSYTLRVELKTTDDEEFKDDPGYRFSVLAELVFRFSGRLSKTHRDSYIRYSAVSLAIAYIRGYLSNVTSYGFYGQYMLPAIDLDDLVKKALRKASLAEQSK
jgi:preprotein translocase subunit SecB